MTVSSHAGDTKDVETWSSLDASLTGGDLPMTSRLSPDSTAFTVP